MQMMVQESLQPHRPERRFGLAYGMMRSSDWQISQPSAIASWMI
jgi:hypothetical protein